MATRYDVSAAAAARLAAFALFVCVWGLCYTGLRLRRDWRVCFDTGTVGKKGAGCSAGSAVVLRSCGAR